MTSQIKLWTIKEGQLVQLTENPFSQAYKEKDLEVGWSKTLLC